MHRRHFTLALGVLLLAAGLRLWRLHEIPPGLHHDEAFHLLRAQEIARGEAWPVYITGNFGNEPLFAYLAALTLPLLGPVPWVGRLVAAWAGIIGVAAAMRAGSEVWRSRRAGLFTGLVLAALYSHLNFSRFGSQPILAVAAAAGTVAALWHGARTGRRLAFTLAGLSLGLGLWSYVAFRLFPLAILFAGLALWVAQPERRGWLWRGGLLAAGAALVVYAPLGAFFIRNPHWFFNRFNQVTEATLLSGSPALVLGANALKVVGGLFMRGDLDWKYNLPPRPLLDPIQASFVLLGIALCVWRWRRPEALAVLAWLAVGLAPSALTEFAPQFHRTIIATPALALLAGLGLERLWHWGRRWAVRGAIVALVLISTGWTVRDYFVRWARDPALFIAFDVGLQQIARQLRAAPANASLFETPVYRHYPTFEYTLGPEAYTRFKYFNGRECFVVPATTLVPTTYAVILVPGEDPYSLPALRAAYPAGQEVASIFNGEALYAAVVEVPAGQAARLSTGTARAVDYGGLVRMRGYALGAGDAHAGEEIRLEVTWEARATTRAAYKIFVHLIGPPRADGSLIYAQRDAEPCDNAYPTWQWSPGEIIADRYRLRLPADLPSGEYSLLVGWYDSGTGERLPAVDSGGRPLGDSAELERIGVSEP